MLRLSLIILISLFAAQPAIAETKTIVLATFDQAAPRLSVTELVMREIYKKLDIELKVDRHPGNRVLSLANSGKVDGVLIRATIIENIAQNLVKINTPIAHVKYVVYTKQAKAFEVDGWGSLKPYSIGIVESLKLVEERTKPFNPEVLTTYSSLFKMLYLERVDLAIFTELDGLYALKKMNLHNEIISLSPALEITPSYHFLHKKHAGLIKRLSSLMQEMQTSGELETLIKRSEMVVINSLP